MLKYYFSTLDSVLGLRPIQSGQTKVSGENFSFWTFVLRMKFCVTSACGISWHVTGCILSHVSSCPLGNDSYLAKII